MSRRGWAALLAAVLLWGGPAAAAGGRGPQPAARRAGGGNQAKKGRSNMTLDLRLELKRTKVITRESLPMEVTLENQGGSPVEVPDPRIGSEFRYTVTSRTDAKAEHHLSATRAQAERYQEPMQPHEEPGKPLAPGGKQSYDEDLAEYQLPVLGPGAYDLRVGYAGADGLVESADVAVTIVPPRVARMVTAAGGSEESVAVLFTHGPDAKHGSLYQIENAAKRPGDGVAYPRKEGIALRELRGLALAVDLDESGGLRWFAWEQGDTLFAGFGQKRYLSHWVAPVALGLKAAALGPVGWQPTDEDALFAAVGTDRSGHAALAIVRCHASAPGTAQLVSLAGQAPPAVWAAQYRPAGDAQLELITAERSGRKMKIARQTIGLADGKATAPVVLFERHGGVTAMAMPPVGQGTADDGVDVLFSPDPKTGYLSLVRLRYADGTTRSAAWDFSAPKNTGGKRPTGWAIPRALLDTPVVATHVGDKIYLRRAGGEWSVVVDGVPHVEHLALEAFRPSSLVAVWFDPGFGIRYHAIP